MTKFQKKKDFPENSGSIFSGISELKKREIFSKIFKYIYGKFEFI